MFCHFGGPVLKSTNGKGVIQSLGRKVRDALIRAFPLEVRTARDHIVRLRNRSEIKVYYELFVQRVYPFEVIHTEVGRIENPVVFDVGANNGQFAAVIFDRWPDACVHSFEPQKQLWRRIHEFAAINNLQDRLFPQWAAIGARAGEQYLYQNRSPVSASLIREKAARRTIRRVVKVPVMTLDEYAEKHGIDQVDILKIDVEGSEIDALRGADHVLKHVRILFVEVHPPFSTFSDAARFLTGKGFKHIYPTQPPDDGVQVTCVFVRGE